MLLAFALKIVGRLECGVGSLLRVALFEFYSIGYGLVLSGLALGWFEFGLECAGMGLDWVGPVAFGGFGFGIETGSPSATLCGRV